MTTLLLDSHCLVWFAEDDRRLSQAARGAIMDPHRTVLVSVASLWELSIKAALGRLRLTGPPEDMMEAYGFPLLPIGIGHIQKPRTLPPHHGDPFDRMLAAQAIADGLTLVTADAKLRSHPISWLW